MAKYRSRLEIIADILNVVGDGAKKTRIMYIANLSYKLLEKYLKKTIEADLISSNNDFYEVTEKGRDFLERYNEFSRKYIMIDDKLRKILLEREVLKRLCEASPQNMKKSVIIGKPAPDFCLKTFDGKDFDFSTFNQNRNVVLVFNRGFT